jgi:hypothetical protein
MLSRERISGMNWNWRGMHQKLGATAGGLCFGFSVTGIAKAEMPVDRNIKLLTVQKYQHHLLMGRKSTQIILLLVRNAFLLGLIIVLVKKTHSFIIFIFADISAWH